MTTLLTADVWTIWETIDSCSVGLLVRFSIAWSHPGATQRHSKNPPVPPLRKGEKGPDAADSVPCEGSEFRVLAFRLRYWVGIINLHLTSVCVPPRELFCYG
jgi:hypothetical protein